MTQKKPEQVVELIVMGSLVFPAVSQLALAGRTVASITLTNAVIEGYSAQVGGARGPRPSQQRTEDHVKVRITCDDVTIVETEG